MSGRDKGGSGFLNDDCGQNALQLAARGSAIIAEILRLSEHIPSVFREGPEKHPHYREIITDFSYFQMQDDFEKTIQNSVELLQRDDEFQQTHIELLERFFKLFRGVHGYILEVNRFVEEIRDDVYISQTIESILVNQDGKQLMCEIYYLYGVMLLLIDHEIGGKVREYLIVSYIRYRGAGEQHTVEVTSLFRDTGYRVDGKLPDQYPTQYFARMTTDKELLGMLIGRLRSDDVYQQAYNYPAPEHRSTALANQGAILWVLLFFRPVFLQHERPIMREIVDKHFADNWVIAYYLGFTVDLVVSWQAFRAATIAIAGTVAVENVTYHQQRLRNSMRATNKNLSEFLLEGVLTEQFVLDNINSRLLPCIREANVALRWFLLHSTRGKPGRRFFENMKTSYESVMTGVSADEILTLLLATAQLEFTLKSMFTQLLKEKRGKWEVAKAQGVSKMTKLATYFSGEHVLSDNVRVAPLETWFTEIAQRIESLGYKDPLTASRKVLKLIKALENVQEFHQIDSNLQVVQFLLDTRTLLKQMLRYVAIERKVLITIATVGDLSYAWELFATHGEYVPEIQAKIKRAPHLAIQMRSAFVKLATMLELPCTRIDQAAFHDSSLTLTLESVSEYYSAELVTFVRRVLHVIPLSIFEVLTQIASLLVNDLKECPTKLAKNDLKELSQLTTRDRLAALTSEIALFANGILTMESTLVGVIQLDPHQLLEDGIRKELTQQITHELHRSLRVDPTRTVPLSAEEFDGMLHNLARRLQGIRQSFEYIQDYVNVHGLRIWLEEFSRILNFNVEMECNSFMQKKLYHWLSKYQSDSIPIPYFERARVTDVYSVLGRCVQHLLVMTDPRRAAFIPCLGAWFELPTAREVVGGRTFSSIVHAIGTRGLKSLDQLICFIIAKDLQVIANRVRRAVEPHAALFAMMKRDLVPLSGVPLGALKLYATAEQHLGKLYGELTDVLVRVGRLQLLRTQAASELRSRCKLNSSLHFNALASVNLALLGDLARHYEAPSDKPMPTEVIAALSPFLASAGMADPHAQVFITTKPLPELCFVLVGLVLRNVSRVSYDARLATLLPRKKEDPFDAAAFACGVVATLKQFHSDLAQLFFGHLSQCVRVSFNEFDSRDVKEKQRNVLPENSVTMCQMMGLLAACSSEPMDEEMRRQLPPTLLWNCLGDEGAPSGKAS